MQGLGSQVGLEIRIAAAGALRGLEILKVATGCMA